MDTPLQPLDQRPPGSALRTADELFARLDCAHLVTLNNPGQNLHLERTPEGFQFTAGSAGAEHPYSRAFPSLEAVYEDWDRVHVRLDDGDRVSVRRSVRRFSLREAIWQDISACPTFPYSVLWLPLESPVELCIPADSEHMTAHGPHVVFGPVAIASPVPQTYRLTATSGWLVVEHPAFTFRGRMGRAILRPTRSLLDRLRLYLENRRLRRDTSIHIRVRSAVLVVYGKPPANWQTIHQLLPATPPAPPA